MKFEEFKVLHTKFRNPDLPAEIWQSEEYSNYIDAMHNSKEFQDWVLIEKFKTENFDYSKFCCLNMADRIFESFDCNGEFKLDDVDVVMRKWEDCTYGIPIHDGGNSIVEIHYCPWCGSKLQDKQSIES